MSESILKEVATALKSGDTRPLFKSLEALASAGEPRAEPDSQPHPQAEHVSGEALGIDAVMNIPVTVQVVLGSTTVPISRLMTLSRGAILPLQHKVGEPVDVVVNGRVVARGELVVMDDDSSRFGVALTEIVTTSQTEDAG